MSHDEVHIIRRRLRLTQQELADLIGVARNTVSRWETGALSINATAAILLRRLAADASEITDGN